MVTSRDGFTPLSRTATSSSHHYPALSVSHLITVLLSWLRSPFFSHLVALFLHRTLLHHNTLFFVHLVTISLSRTVSSDNQSPDYEHHEVPPHSAPAINSETCDTIISHHFSAVIKLFFAAGVFWYFFGLFHINTFASTIKKSQKNRHFKEKFIPYVWHGYTGENNHSNKNNRKTIPTPALPTVLRVMATSSDFKHERRRQWRRRGHDIIKVWICFPRCSEKWSCSDVSDRGTDCRWSPMMVGWRKSSDVSATDCRQPRAKCCMWAVGWLIRGNWWMRCDTISPSLKSLTHLPAPAPL